MNNNNSNKIKKFSSNVGRTPAEMDAMLDTFSEGLALAQSLGYRECMLCKTMSKEDSPCETCGKPRTDYAEDIVLSNKDLMKGFDRMIAWADKKKKEGKKERKKR